MTLMITKKSTHRIIQYNLQTHNRQTIRSLSFEILRLHNWKYETMSNWNKLSNLREDILLCAINIFVYGIIRKSKICLVEMENF